MALTCPACRASNDAGPACRRCRADLTLLFAVDAQRSAELTAGRTALAQGDADAAFASANRADELRRGADSARLAAVASLIKRDFAAAWKEYQQARSLTGG
jgi:hypothetical protein